MKRLSTLIAAILLLALSMHAADNTVYQTGRLIDIRSRPGGLCLAIQLDDISYIVLAPWRSTTLIAGDPIQLRIKPGKSTKFWDSETKMYIRQGKTHFDDQKVSIMRRERITPEKKASTCALPVEIEPH